jgi:formate-dependent nitrite reductase cytochrome c552 subunit
MITQNINGVDVPLTDAEMMELVEREAAWEAGKTDRKLKEIRTKRNAMLKDSDYMMLEDSGIDKEAAKAYRQALRDVTKQADLDNVVWPTKP